MNNEQEKNLQENEVNKVENTQENQENSQPEIKAQNHEATKETQENSIQDQNSKSETEVVETVDESNASDFGTPEHNPDDFDWSMDKEGFSTYDKDEKEKLVNLYENSVKSIEQGTVVKATVVSLTDKDVILNVGSKSDGMVTRTEFRDMPDLAVGDEVEVFVDEAENELGQLVLSRKLALQEKSWDHIIKALEEGEILNGFVKSRTKGGLVVDLLGLDAFLPGSQIDIKPVRDYDQYVGQVMQFKVIKINEVYKNVVISHKALIEDDIEQQKLEIIKSIEKGQVLEGIVKNMTDFGVFVDLGGVDGLLHITDISWGRINHPEDVLALDQKITVAVLDFDENKNRISLGMKQLTEHPWEKMGDSIKEGAKVKGKVVTVADYGAFIEIEEGIEGLIHVSEMSWSQHLRTPQDFLKVGDEIEAVVLSVDKDDYKLSLGLKQLTPDPWEKIEDKFKPGSKHSGVVRNLTNYGLFVELEEGVDGLVHVSDLSWSKKIKHPAEFIKKGETIDVIVLEIDRENRRLSLGHKQLDENPWDTYETIFAEGTEHNAIVTEVNENGALVQMPYGVEAFAPNKHIKKQDKTTITVDEELSFRVIEFSKDAKRIIISHTDIWKDEERAQRGKDRQAEERKNKRSSKIVEQINRSSDVSTLGDLDALTQLKAQMEAGDKKAKKKTEPIKTESIKDEVNKVKEEVVDKSENIDSKEVPSTEKVEEIIENSKDEKTDASKTIEVALESKIEEKSNEADDLKTINGIGPAFEKRLNALGIFKYSDLIALNEEKIENLEKESGDAMTSIEQWNEWIAQAKELNQ